LFSRRGLDAPAPDAGQRAWLTFEGMFYQGDVWLDGTYLGDTEGYFFPHTFEVTEALAARSEHTLAVEVACHRPADRTAKRNLTGIFQHWDCIDPAWNPGGIWAPVRVHRSGPIRIESLRVVCPDANAERATLDIVAHLDAAGPASVVMATTVSDGTASVVAAQDEEQTLAAGHNQVRWRVQVERPHLWWPHALGAQPLYEVRVSVASPPSDERVVTTGLRQVRMRQFVLSVNGERLFLKGTNLGPTRRALGEATPEEVAADVTLARQAGLDLVRVHAHVGRVETYEAADRQGVLVWQDLPLQWGYAGVRKQAAHQARQAVALLAHHPSIALWCGHNEPLALDLAPGAAVSRREALRFARGQALPSWNKTVLDRSIRRSLAKADGSRPVVAHSGVLPHPAWGTDTHAYFGWYHGEERDLPRALARLPVLARFVSEFGAQAVPETAGFMDPAAWPELDWDHLEEAHSLQRRLIDKHASSGAASGFEEWRRATQEYQATLIRFHIEALRRLKYRPTGGFCQFLLADAQPAVTWSLLDHERVPKAGWAALVAACAPVIVVCDRPSEVYSPGERLRLDVHAVSDLRVPIAGATATAVLTWPGGSRRWRFTGDVAADACSRVGRIDATLPADASEGDILVKLSLDWPERTGPGVLAAYRSHLAPA
ncbi:MAG: glycoside hydrolase family 2 protein, partial [Acidimicrobiales bacterium]